MCLEHFREAELSLRPSLGSHVTTLLPYPIVTILYKTGLASRREDRPHFSMGTVQIIGGHVLELSHTAKRGGTRR